MRKIDYTDKELMKDIVEWDVSNWSRALEFWEIVPEINIQLPPRTRQKALDVGGRNGGLSLYWALKGYDVTCSDITDNFDKAKMLHAKYGVSCEYKNLNILELDEQNTYDVITFKSVLGGVGRDNGYDRQEKMIENIYSALKPGGRLVFVENLKASVMHSFLRRKFRKWGQSWRYPTLDEIKELTAKFSSVSYKTVGFFGCLAKGPIAVMSGAFDFIDKTIDSTIPDESRYIVSCIAKK